MICTSLIHVKLICKPTTSYFEGGVICALGVLLPPAHPPIWLQFSILTTAFFLWKPRLKTVQKMKEFFFYMYYQNNNSVFKYFKAHINGYRYTCTFQTFCDLQKTLNWFQSSINLTLSNIIMCITHIYCDFSIWTFHLQAQNSLDNR